MTDIEYNEFYDRKKKETIDKLIGADVNLPISPDMHTTVSAKASKKNADVCYSHKLAMKWLAKYNTDKYTNHGKNVTYIELEPEDASSESSK